MSDRVGGGEPGRREPAGQDQAGQDQAEQDQAEQDLVGEDLAGQDPDHDPAGTDLARQVARAVAASQRTRRRRRKRDRPEPTLSGARPDDRDPALLGGAVERLMTDRGWATTVDAHTLLAQWALLVGPANAEHSRPEGYDDGIVTVRTDSTAWATQLRGLAPQIVAQLNAKLGDGTVTRIDVRGPHAPSWKHGRLSVPGSRGPRDTYG